MRRKQIKEDYKNRKKIKVQFLEEIQGLIVSHYAQKIEKKTMQIQGQIK